MSNGYQPDWTSPPGVVLEDWRARHHLSRPDLAEQLGLSQRELAELITGQMELTLDLVLRLQDVTGIPRRMWAVMEATYQAHRTRQSMAFDE